MRTWNLGQRSKVEGEVPAVKSTAHPTDTPVMDVSPPSAALDDESRLLRKELKRIADANRPLDSWERYRALNDAIDEAYEQIDLGNREARFALILMGGLNAGLIVLATRSDLRQNLSGMHRTWMMLLFIVYLVMAVRFLLQAIEALRPGKFRPHLPGWPRGSEDFPRGVRYYEDVIQRNAEDHWRAWSDVRIGQLNAELAVQFHSLCQKNEQRHLAVRRLYSGLRLMTMLLACLAGLLIFYAWM